jgi:predicted nucleotidyltransferase
VTTKGLDAQVGDALPHLAANQVRALVDALGRVVEAYEPERIYVFGSRARGTPHADSDIDILIVVADAVEPT